MDTILLNVIAGGAKDNDIYKTKTGLPCKILGKVNNLGKEMVSVYIYPLEHEVLLEQDYPLTTISEADKKKLLQLPSPLAPAPRTSSAAYTSTARTVRHRPIGALPKTHIIDKALLDDEHPYDIVRKVKEQYPDDDPDTIKRMISVRKSQLKKAGKL